MQEGGLGTWGYGFWERVVSVVWREEVRLEGESSGGGWDILEEERAERVVYSVGIVDFRRNVIENRGWLRRQRRVGPQAPSIAFLPWILFSLIAALFPEKHLELQ